MGSCVRRKQKLPVLAQHYHRWHWSMEQSIGNNDWFMANVAHAVKIERVEISHGTNTLVFIFDQSSCHKVFVENALNINQMNAQLGDKKPCMRHCVGCTCTEARG